jgi:hypothetical protein
VNCACQRRPSRSFPLLILSHSLTSLIHDFLTYSLTYLMYNSPQAPPLLLTPECLTHTLMHVNHYFTQINQSLTDTHLLNASLTSLTHACASAHNDTHSLNASHTHACASAQVLYFPLLTLSHSRTYLFTLALTYSFSLPTHSLSITHSLILEAVMRIII